MKLSEFLQEGISNLTDDLKKEIAKVKSVVPERKDLFVKTLSYILDEIGSGKVNKKELAKDYVSAFGNVVWSECKDPQERKRIMKKFFEIVDVFMNEEIIYESSSVKKLKTVYPSKERFLSEVRSFLKQVAKKLIAEGWKPDKDTKSKFGVYINKGGPAVSGSVILLLWKNDKIGIYIQISSLVYDFYYTGKVDLSKDKGSCLIRATTPKNKWSGLANNFFQPPITVDEVVELAKKIVERNEEKISEEAKDIAIDVEDKNLYKIEVRSDDLDYNVKEIKSILKEKDFDLVCIQKCGEIYHIYFTGKKVKSLLKGEILELKKKLNGFLAVKVIRWKYPDKFCKEVYKNNKLLSKILEESDNESESEKFLTEESLVQRKNKLNKIFRNFGEIRTVKGFNFWVNVDPDVPRDAISFVYNFIVKAYKEGLDNAIKYYEKLFREKRKQYKKNPKAFIEGFSKAISFMEKMIDEIKKRKERFGF